MVQITPDMRTGRQKGQKRAPKVNPTSKAMEAVNARMAARKLTALLNNNFVDDDFHITLTYKEEVSSVEAQQNLKKFLRNLRETCKRKKIELKWIAITEYENHRIHHHIVCSHIDTREITKRWNKHGHVSITPLYSAGNYKNLAEYLVKETARTFRKSTSPINRRYARSRNLIMPDEEIEYVRYDDATYEPEAMEGYYIVSDSVCRYENAYNSAPSIEYILIRRRE